MTAYALYTVLTLVVLFLVSAIRILREYQRGVVFLLGRFWKVKGPGFIIIIPLIQQMVRVDLRTVVMDVPTQDVISRDNVSVQVNAVIGRTGKGYETRIGFDLDDPEAWERTQRIARLARSIGHHIAGVAGRRIGDHDVVRTPLVTAGAEPVLVKGNADLIAQ